MNKVSSVNRFRKISGTAWGSTFILGDLRLFSDLYDDQEFVIGLEKHKVDSLPAIEKTELDEEIVEQEQDPPEWQALVNGVQPFASSHRICGEGIVEIEFRSFDSFQVRRDRGVPIPSLQPMIETFAEGAVVQRRVKRPTRACKFQLFVQQSGIANCARPYETVKPDVRDTVVRETGTEKEDPSAQPKGVDAIRVGRDGDPDFVLQSASARLVGIDDEHPVVVEFDLMQPMVTLTGKIVETSLNDSDVSIVPEYADGVVRAEGVENHDVVGPRY